MASLGTQLRASWPMVKAVRRELLIVGVIFLIGVLVPAVWLYLRDEKGEWTFPGIVWSLAGGALGAIGALGLILAFTFGGRPIYVMPLVFGGAPVVNAFLTIYLAGRVKEIGPWFLAGLIMVILGAMIVLVSSPHAPPSAATTPFSSSSTRRTSSRAASRWERCSTSPPSCRARASMPWN